jgi:tubulin beta
MVREIIHVQVGQCGNQVGTAFWKAVFKEHDLDTNGEYEKPKTEAADADGDGIPDTLENVSVYFRPTSEEKLNAKYIPRAVLVDLEPGTMDVIKACSIGKVFKPDNMCFGANGAGNNWAKGHYTEGAELVEEVLDKIRQEIEQCDAPQGFQLFHSLGGGTGSGMGTLLLLKIRDGYPDRITTTYSVYPSPKVSDTVVEPYNAVLSSHQLLENSDETFIVDNEALYNISNNVLKKQNPTYSQLNDLIAQATCGITSSLRFPGALNGDLRKLGVNLVPFPRLHFFLITQAPLAAKEDSNKAVLNVKELRKQAFSQRNFYSNVKPDDGKYLAGSFCFRGSMSTQEVDDNMEKLQGEHGDDFVEWIPNNLKSAIISRPPTTSNMSCTFIANTTALKSIFQRLATQFGAMYRRKAFLHWYKGEGMDEMEFQEADKNVRDLITEYQDKQDATYEEEEDEDEDEDEEI